MEIILNHIDEHEKQLAITVPWETIAEDYAEVLKNYSRLPLRGFRPGRTPAAMIESQFRQQILDDLLTLCSRRLCRKALQEKELEAGSPLEITEYALSKGESLSFKANFIEMPEFELPDYRNLELSGVSPEEKLDEISEKLLERTAMPELHASFVDKELQYSEEDEEDRVGADQRVRLMMILKRIGEQDGIEVDQQQIDGRIAEIAAGNGISTAEVKNFLIANHGLTRLADFLLAESVLQYILEIQPS